MLKDLRQHGSVEEFLSAKIVRYAIVSPIILAMMFWFDNGISLHSVASLAIIEVCLLGFLGFRYSVEVSQRSKSIRRRSRIWKVNTPNTQGVLASAEGPKTSDRRYGLVRRILSPVDRETFTPEGMAPPRLITSTTYLGSRQRRRSRSKNR